MQSTRGQSRGRGRGSRGRGEFQRLSNAVQNVAGPSQSIPGGIPSGSISKLKSQLRQTRRLLARDDLTPDVRTTSDRRLQTLESELAKAERSELEKKMVTKYRGIRFFERQKLLRKIKQLKKTLQDPEGPKADSEKALLAARVDLTYVLHYPKTQKYVALFPEGTYVPFSIDDELAADAPAAERTRHDLRLKIQRAMADQTVGDAIEEGELALAPSLDEDADVDGPRKEPGDAIDHRPVAGKRAREDSAPVQAAISVKKSRNDAIATTTTAPPMVASARSPPLVMANTAATASKPSKGDAIEGSDVSANGATVKSNKKLKKDAKDAKRRAKKLAEAQAARGEAGKQVEADAFMKENSSAGLQEVEVKTGLAAEDDFFA